VSHTSSNELLVLQALRTLGYADLPRLAVRLARSEDDVREDLLDAQAYGWATWSSFAGDGGWSLTEAGKAQGERLLAAELVATGARAAVEDVHHRFLPLNAAVAQACTDHQLAELGVGDRLVPLEVTLGALTLAAEALATLEESLTSHLERFRGYHARFGAAIGQAAEDPRWITGLDRDSAHRVWFELHEDLIATLGLTR
jgi:hypothetical protein